MTILSFFINIILTVIIETSFFYMFGYRTKKFILVCVIINILTNISLNLILYFFFKDSSYYYLYALIFELIVILIEATSYMVFNKKDYKLIPLTVSSNALSFLVGCMFYYLMFYLFNINFF